MICRVIGIYLRLVIYVTRKPEQWVGLGDNILWSLELASKFLHVFFPYNIGGEELDPISLKKGEIPERTRSRLIRNLVAEEQFGHEERALWSEGIRDRNVN